MFQIIGVPVTTSEFGKYVLIRSSAGLLAPETYNISTPISRVNTAFFVSLNLPCWNLPSKYLNFMHKVDFFASEKKTDFMQNKDTTTTKTAYQQLKYQNQA